MRTVDYTYYTGRHQMARGWHFGLGIGLALAAQSLLFSTPALAAYNCQLDLQHCYSYSKLTDGRTTTGLFGTWQSGNLSPDSATPDAHVNTTIWLATTSNPLQWVETGLVTYSPGSQRTSNYEAYWYDVDSSGTPYFHDGPAASPDGSEHNYEIQQNSHVNWWNVYRDYNFVGTSTDQSSWTGCPGCARAGGEVAVYYECPGPRSSDCGTDFDTSESAGPFDLYLESKNTAGGWYYWPSQTQFTDLGCGPNPSGYCLNGYPYYTYEWSWNKP